MSEWQPIETAPKDGTEIALGVWREHDGAIFWEQTVGAWNLHPKPGEFGLHGFNAYLHEPTHWLPLPTPPSAR